MSEPNSSERFVEPGGIGRLRSRLDAWGVSSVFLVTHLEAYRCSGAEKALAQPLSALEVTQFTDFEPNPQIDDAQRALALWERKACDVVLAVGGGSAIDMAKLVCAFADQQKTARKTITDGEPLAPSKVRLIAIPTTAGTGSEATHFAVVYVDGAKYSVAHPSLLPDLAIVDSELTYSMPPYLTAASGLDALSQGIESLWSVRSTSESKTFARQAVRLAMRHLAESVTSGSPGSRQAMSRAAHLAGQAINLSRTTAPHAISYALGACCGIPHGHAVALTLGQLLVFNSEVTDHDCVDPRGAGYVRETLGEILGAFDCESAGEALVRWTDLMRSVGCATRLSELGVTYEAIKDQVVGSVNVERLNNNPRVLTADSLSEILMSIR